MNFRERARQIVENALRATATNVDPQKLANWESTPLGNFLGAEQVAEFLRLVFAEAEKSEGDAELQDFLRKLSSEPLRAFPGAIVITYIEAYLEQADFQARLQANDPAALTLAEKRRKDAEELSKQPAAPDRVSPAISRDQPADVYGCGGSEDEQAEEQNERWDSLDIPSYLRRTQPVAAAEPPAPAPAEEARPAAAAAYAPAEEVWPLVEEKAPSEATIVRVFYATDRLQLPKVTSDVQYGRERSPMGALNYGKCEISIPKSHKVGNLESPSILRLEFRPDYRKHIVLKKTFSCEERAFFEMVQLSVAKSAAKDAFVFVHGYNVSFEDAARRTGQIAFDLDFVGAPVFYSWPSNDKTADYPRDETNIAWSTPHFQRFLTLLCQNSGAERIHIIAHSMGNRAVCDALRTLSYDSTSQVRLSHLVLAAPDIDAETFAELAEALRRLSARITLYESSKDKALMASKHLHGNPRAGEPLLVVPGVDTIDATAINTDFLAHSYFSDSWPLLSDIHSLLFKNDQPSNRFGLTEIQHQDGTYYAFKA